MVEASETKRVLAGEGSYSHGLMTTRERDEKLQIGGTKGPKLSKIASRSSPLESQDCAGSRCLEDTPGIFPRKGSLAGWLDSMVRRRPG